MSCLQYKLTSSYDRMTDVGPVIPLHVTEEGTCKGREAPPVDPARLLVKAWEDKVFPVIRRRFRSNTDRQSGLEQIKGALLAGRQRGGVRSLLFASLFPTCFTFGLDAEVMLNLIKEL